LEQEMWREMGLSKDEYGSIVSILGRVPNKVELGMFAAMWSEHCSYKNSKEILRLFPTSGDRVIQGPGENAGAMDIGDGLAVVFKIESHNHPSAVEPFQGAATGVGGIVRDVLAMGAEPIALLGVLRAGPLSDKRSRWILRRATEGMTWYGDALGIPAVGGDLATHESFRENPLVNAMCVGIVEISSMKKSAAHGLGNPVIVVGARTGRDGIQGAAFASQEIAPEVRAGGEALQIGDSKLGHALKEACLELYDVLGDSLKGIQDMGAAGLTCSSAEMASKGDVGMEIDVSRVPRREEGMTPYEVMLSESHHNQRLHTVCFCSRNRHP
jgi:phosphoribosylformylglycinamidine synthase II